tara:strand:+ start:44 stop:736 length:693 start_codon:yes stop_codon:yes gene_type:complete
MSNKLTILTLILSILTFLSLNTSNLVIYTPESNKEVKELPKNFDKVFSTFNNYNNHNDTLLAITFCKVSDFYKLDTSEFIFDWLLGQVLLESGAQQYRKDGELVLSSTGAVGFAQILRSTSIGYLRKTITKSDSSIFKDMGVTDYSFVNNKKYCKSEKWGKAKTWLSNEVNNITLWGKIMSSELKSRTITDALISYNIGPSQLKSYLGAGNSGMLHHYIVGIKNRMSHIK